MPPSEVRYEWKISFRNEKKGFQKYVTLTARGHQRAILYGYDALANQGYNRDDFAVIKLERGKALSA